MVSSAVPSKENAMKALAETPDDTSKSGFKQCLYDSVYAYNEAVEAVSEEIRKLLAKYDLELMHKVK